MRVRRSDLEDVLERVVMLPLVEQPHPEIMRRLRAAIRQPEGTEQVKEPNEPG